jgi:hypothetical protein
MICQQVTLSGYAEGPKVADAVIEAEWHGQMPVKGLKKCQMLALGAILLCQIVLLYQHQRQQPVGVGIKALLRAA